MKFCKSLNNQKKKYKDDLDNLLKKRYIRVLTTYNKTNYFIANSNILGFEYSLLKNYEKYLNKGSKRSEIKTVLEFIPVSRDQLIPMLNEGLGNIVAAGLTITHERQMQADFTDPYLTKIDEIVVVNKNIDDINTLSDLSGHAIFVRESSSYYVNLVALNKRFKKESKPGIHIVKADETLETEDILELVNSGAIDITISDSHIAKIWSKIFTNIRLLKNIKIREDAKIAWMGRKNNLKLKTSLSQFLKSHKKGTLLGNIYFNKFYKNNKWIKNPLNSDDKKRLKEYKELFKKYGLDWVLIMALAYQESGLDNNKKNPSGATGIMQILPTTAKDKNIGIKNIENIENNIHAGVKYLAFLRDHYFKDTKLNDSNRIRFMLASYNAGPAKIQRARRLAKSMGIDKDKWFRNVEMAVLKIVGQETVKYVSNINKYYIVYKLGFND